ncbi:hypothetical protein CC80DRAFT_506532 [Byssothecium circinans]|uniref:Uncharacterized protein n=1 Tax=Byssothecium circinans TaxID=147558 RepID=A0A6A5TMK5_9PLEO|nr:hypothetical protein CC80DRAFT_506532 [Byssothecium circinans]
MALRLPNNFDRANTIDKAPTTPFSSLPSMECSAQFKDPICTKPFDQWRPRGGGAERDIFRYFKIFPIEEAAFLTLWAAKRPTSGYLSHDENGTLVFRISSTHLSELATMGISGVNSVVPDVDAQWLQVCDREGASWLTQFRHRDIRHFPSELFDTTGRPITANGRVGWFGLSALSVQDFVQRQT